MWEAEQNDINLILQPDKCVHLNEESDMKQTSKLRNRTLTNLRYHQAGFIRHLMQLHSLNYLSETRNFTKLLHFNFMTEIYSTLLFYIIILLVQSDTANLT